MPNKQRLAKDKQRQEFLKGNCYIMKARKPKQMQDKLKQYFWRVWPYAYRLRDVRFVGQVLFVVIVLLISWSGVKAIDANYVLQKQIASLEQQNTLQRLENSNQRLQNEYYNSDQYLELSARQNFGLAAPGEKEIIVPENVALSYIVPEPKPPKPAPAGEQPLYRRNLEAWLNFFLHRPQPAN